MPGKALLYWQQTTPKFKPKGTDENHGVLGGEQLRAVSIATRKSDGATRCATERRESEGELSGVNQASKTRRAKGLHFNWTGLWSNL